MQTATRLPTIVGDPTAHSIAMFQKRVFQRLTKGLEGEDFKRELTLASQTEQRMRPPMGRLIGHGQQLAAIRERKAAEAMPTTSDSVDSRQVKRRVELKARKKTAAAERKAAIANRLRQTRKKTGTA